MFFFKLTHTHKHSQHPIFTPIHIKPALTLTQSYAKSFTHPFIHLHFSNTLLSSHYITIYSSLLIPTQIIIPHLHHSFNNISGLPGRVHISDPTYQFVKDDYVVEKGEPVPGGCGNGKGYEWVRRS